MLTEFDISLLPIDGKRKDLLSMKVKEDIRGSQGAFVQYHSNFHITFISRFLVQGQTEVIELDLLNGIVSFFRLLVREVMSVLISKVRVKY
jgi:hypothetical protein